MSDAEAWRLRVAVPMPAIPAFEEALAEEDAALSSFEIPGSTLWSIEALGPHRPNREAVEARLRLAAEAMGLPAPALLIEPVHERDWVAESLRGLKPVRAGRYFVHGSHDRSRRPAGAVALQIEAAAAFGTGHHESTLGCLLLLDALARRRRFRRPLDLGCGSAVLAMAAAATWRVPVLATDIDPTAVRVARDNVRLNGLSGLIRCIVAEGLADAAIRQGVPYDLVMANILARPLVDLAPAITRSAPHATLILAGLLREQSREVLGHYRLLGWRLRRRLGLGAWAILHLDRP